MRCGIFYGLNASLSEGLGFLVQENDGVFPSPRREMTLQISRTAVDARILKCSSQYRRTHIHTYMHGKYMCVAF